MQKVENRIFYNTIQIVLIEKVESCNTFMNSSLRYQWEIDLKEIKEIIHS